MFFPVSSSILSAAHLGPYLQALYAMSDRVTCRLLRAGINHTYLVTDGAAEYVFRVYSLDWRSVSEIEAEINLLDQLHKSGMAVSYALPAAHGRYIETLPAPEGDRYAVLFSHAPGDKLHNFPPALHAEAGAFMARFHALTHEQQINRITYTPHNLLLDPLQELSKFLPADAPAMFYMVKLQARLLEILSGVKPDQLRKGVVHLDTWFDNMHITKDGVITLFDFDFCGNGWQCLDIAYYLMQLYVVEPDAREYQIKSEHFLEGYQGLTPISDEERRLLPALGLSLYFFYLGVQCRRFEDFSNVFLNPTYLERYILLRVKKYAEFHGIILPG